MKTKYNKYSIILIIILILGVMGITVQNKKVSNTKKQKTWKKYIVKIANADTFKLDDKKIQTVIKDLKNEGSLEKDNKGSNETEKKENNDIANNQNEQQNTNQTQAPQPETTPKPAPKPQPTPPQPAPQQNVGTYTEALSLVNQIRNQSGLSSLSMGNAQLQNAANIRANEITTNFSHTRNGQPWYSIFQELGIQAATGGENIYFDSAGGNYVEAVVAWINSPGHLNNILNPDATQVVIGKNGGYYVMILI